MYTCEIIDHKKSITIMNKKCNPEELSYILNIYKI